ncbi:uncharacterized protein C9orf85 homolog, partial [Pseudochaenichthys georgianus]|uniref:uncharacterized protein C9orf85 homolog n=1 Tax=Pseudochaenichthys georgianus TaxID=52239 RepID=UPI0039C4A630
ILSCHLHFFVCKHCKGVLEWRVRYNKYKSLTQPKKCIKCAQRTVKDAYHILCKPCSLELDICCKCGKKEKIVIPINSGDNNDEEGGEEEEGEEKDEEKGEVKEEVKGEEKGEEKNEEKGEEKVVEQKKKVRVRAKKDLDDSDSDDDDDDEEREDLHSGSKSKKTQNKSDDLPDVSRLQVRFND